VPVGTTKPEDVVVVVPGFVVVEDDTGCENVSDAFSTVLVFAVGSVGTNVVVVGLKSGVGAAVFSVLPRAGRALRNEATRMYALLT